MSPRTLYGRVLLISLLALLVAHVLNFLVGSAIDLRTERASEGYFISKDVAAAVAILDRTPPAERAAWLARFDRVNRHFRVDAAPGVPPQPRVADDLVAAVTRELGPGARVSASDPHVASALLTLDVGLHDGSWLHADIARPDVPNRLWQGVFVVVQMTTIALFTWIAVRQATRPLSRLAQAAEKLGTTFGADTLPESGPTEVARAAAAFNRMSRRIAEHLAERMQILAAITHDLQTPITRMRLRADLTDDPAVRARLHADLDAMQSLVEQGMAYARSAHSTAEPAVRLDVDALLDAIVCDYRDAGHKIVLHGRVGRPFGARPQALQRILVNLVDNALRYAQAPEIAVMTGDMLALEVRDRGPGIPESELEQVMKPYYRLEGSRSRETGGAGLGLAIAGQLAASMGGTLTLANRDAGGLVARLALPEQAL